MDVRINRIAARQQRLISLEQLRAVGLTKREVQRRMERGQLHRVHRGVFIVGPANLEPKAHLKAALLALGPNAFLSHRTSLAAQGLRPIAASHIEITVVADRTPTRPGLVVHRTATPPHRTELRSRFGLRYSSFARAMIETAASETPNEVIRLISEAVRRGIADFSAIGAALDRHPRRPGTARLRLLLNRYLDPTDRKSELERSFDAHAATDPRIPRYEKNVRQGPHEIDCLFRAQRLVLELDGRPYHTALQDMDRDRAKDIWFQRHGLRVMRMTDFRWEHDRAGAVDDLLALLRLGELPEAA